MLQQQKQCAKAIVGAQRVGALALSMRSVDMLTSGK